MDNNDKTAKEINMDSSSMASVLAAVGRMRDEFENGSSALTNQDTDMSHKRQKVGQGASLPPPVSRRPDLTTNRNAQVGTIPTSTSTSTSTSTARSTFSKRTSRTILVSRSQTGNPLLEHLTFYETSPLLRDVDYQLSPSCAVLFLSTKYHQLHPEYISTRLQKVRHARFEPGNTIIVLLLIDTENFQAPLVELNKFAIRNSLTLLVAHSNIEGATYLNNLRAVASSSTTARASVGKLIAGKEAQTALEGAIGSLKSIRAINTRDSQRLLAQFGSIRDVVLHADASALENVDGLGPRKVDSLVDALRGEFMLKE